MINCSVSIQSTWIHVTGTARTSDINWQNATSNFSCQQLQMYGDLLDEWNPIGERIVYAIYCSLAVAGSLGIIGYILMALTYRLPSFQGVSFIYHRSIVVIELLHMAVMTQAGIVEALKTHKATFSFVVYQDVLNDLWVIGDGAKLAATMITMFMSLERAVALWYPLGFEKFNKPSIAWTLVIASVIIGCLHLSPTLASVVVQDPIDSDQYRKVQTNYGQAGYDSAVSQFIYGLKIAVSITILIFCVMVAVGLLYQSKYMQTSANAWTDKWNEMKQLSVMQMIVAISCVIDHIFWVLNKVVKARETKPVGPEAVVSLTFDEAIAALDNRRLFVWTWLLQALSGEIDHGGRFYMYMMFMYSFRKSFFGMIHFNSDKHRSGWS